MAKATLNSLSESEQALVVSTAASNLRGLDEDELIALLDRVRRARTKHVQLHRRSVAAQVGVKGARGTASSAPRRSESKAEIFESALARVSAALAKSARQSAAELKAARLAGAQSSGPSTGSGATPRRTTSAPGGGEATANTRARARRPVERKTASAAKAAGARRQASSDARG